MSAAVQPLSKESGALRHSLSIPGSHHKVSVEVSLLAGDELAPSLQGSSNVAKVAVGGMELFAVVARTTIDPYG